MLESFNLWFSHWEWSLALICSIIVLALAVCGLALAITFGSGGGGHVVKRPKPRGGEWVRWSDDFIHFMRQIRKR